MTKTSKLLEDMRIIIDETDSRIVELLHKRCSVAVEIGKEKERLGLPVENKEREQRIMEKFNHLPLTDPNSFSPMAMKEIFGAIIDETRYHESCHAQIV